MIEVEFLEGPEVLDELRKTLREAQSFKSTVAFLKKNGYDVIRNDLISLLERRAPRPRLHAAQRTGCVWDPLP